ncbi:MAG: ribosomal protein S18-alanine N-acetyltransferase [Candidatus Marinimicrobia bacterium]|nr:ribosomal protein S18-alanine N-acetyltransferase [Candidatus Neomarinimicrobiota bacterium]MCF7829811.1 ribosomal protein S18-alanine N-acetyltransferase [Candidatus Neomarinimicrobiota bacterium]MCF7881756.1 ribosomal protein S18-alanine N-acetyltransferase [Candidatus Neomarinimicrobiota bacterium]
MIELQHTDLDVDTDDPKPKIVIRDMDVSDLSDVLRIEQETFLHPWKKLHFLSSLYRKPMAQCWVAEAEERIVGYLIAWYISRYSGELGEVHIHNIAVVQALQRKGLGAKMLRHAVEYGKRQGISVVGLEVRESNTKALRFYRHFGFDVIGRREKYYGDEDALLMECGVDNLLTQMR